MSDQSDILTDNDRHDPNGEGALISRFPDDLEPNAHRAGGEIASKSKDNNVATMAASELILEPHAEAEARTREETNIWQDINRRLDSGELIGGELPASFREMERLIEFESAEGQAFQKYMETLTLMMLPGWDFQKYPILFLMSDAKEINAGVLAGRKPSLMIFNIGLLKFVGKNANKLMHVLGHELGHDLLREAVGAVGVTAPEEILVNMPSIQWMYENGINPQPAVDFAWDVAHLDREKFESKDTGFIDLAMDMAITAADEHLPPAFDLDIINNAVVAYRNQIAGTFDDRLILEIPQEMQALFKKAKHVSHIEKTVANLAKPFGKMSWEDQLGFIRDQLAVINEGYMVERAPDLLDLLQKVDNPVNEKSKAYAEEMVALLSDRTYAFLKLYGTINVNLYNQRRELPIPPLTDLIFAMRAVVEADSYENFCMAAARLRQMVTDFRYPLKELEWPHSFTMPTRAAIYDAGPSGHVVPWDQHVKWAVTARRNNDPTPIIALLMLGVEDPRLLSVMSSPLLEKIRTSADIGLNSYIDVSINSWSTFPILGQPTQPINAFNIRVVNGEGRIQVATLGRAWNMAAAAHAVLTRRQAAIVSLMPSAPREVEYKFDGTLPFRSRAQFEAWFSQYRASLIPPAVLMEVGAAAVRIQNLLLNWYQETEDTRSAHINGYQIAIANGEAWRTARYDALFFHTFTQKILPFENQAAEVVSMLDAQLEQSGATGRRLVREFFLNPVEKPGLRQLLESGSRGAFLSPYCVYANFLTSHPGIFSVEEKASILSEHVPFPSDIHWWQKILETPTVADVRTLHEFINTAQKFYDNIRSLGKKTPRNSFVKEDDTNPKFYFTDVAETYFTAIFGYNYAGQFDLAPFLEIPPALMVDVCSAEKENFEDTMDISDGRFIEPYLTEHTRNTFTGKSDKNSGTSNASGRFDRQKFMSTYFAFGNPPEDLPAIGSETIREILRKHVAAQSEWGSGHVRRAKIYKNIDRFDLFPNYEWQEQFRERLLSDIQEETDLDRRLTSAQILLGGEPLKDPTARQQAIELWAKTIREKMNVQGLGENGLDDGAEAYQNALMPYVESAEQEVPIAERYQLFVHLADALETQRTLSYRLRDSFLVSGENLQSMDIYFRGTAAILVYASKRPNNRQLMLDFLMSDPTDDSMKDFGGWLLKQRKSIGTHPDDDREADFVAILSPTNDPQYFTMHAQNTYNNFWQAPLPARIAIIDQLLLTPEEKVYETGRKAGKKSRDAANAEKAYDRAFDYVVDKLLPADLRYARESRIALETYKNILPLNERALFLSALLAASDAAKRSDNTLSAGERLAIILEMMGPATVKFGQGLSNYPDAPLDLRQPMVRLTKNAAPSVRWELWRRYDDVVPLAYQQTVERMERVMGTGSYQESIRLKKKTGTRSVIKLQRAYVERRANAGFSLLREFVDELQKSEATIGKEVAEATDAITAEAQRMAVKETDSIYRLRQVKQAQDYYNSLSITVDGHTFRFHTAAWLAYGVDRDDVPHRIDRKEWCDEEEMPGVHFDELPEDTAEQRAYKKAVAKATIIAEFLILLSGRPIDDDRHVAQMRIDAALDRIGLFDHGGLDLEPPTKEEKQLLARVLANATQNYEEGISISELIYKQLHEIKEQRGGIPDYLVKVERAALALTPFFQWLSADDLEEVVAAVHGTGMIDPEILDARVQVKLPIIGETNLKLSTALSQGLPTQSGIAINQQAQALIAEPIRFDYVYPTQTAHPHFPGVRAVDQNASKPEVGEDIIRGYDLVAARPFVWKMGGAGAGDGRLKEPVYI
jgi:hypothetical protein